MLDEYATALKTGKQLRTNCVLIELNKAKRSAFAAPKRRERALYIAPARRLADAKGTPESSTGCPIRDATRQRVAKEMQKRRTELAKTTGPKSASTEPALDPKQPLFKLELLDIHGVVHSCVVYAVNFPPLFMHEIFELPPQGDSAARVAKMYCQKLELPPECATELRQRIESQLEEHTQRASSTMPSSSSVVPTRQEDASEEMQFHDAPEVLKSNGFFSTLLTHLQPSPPKSNRRRVIAKDTLTGLRRTVSNNIQQSAQRRVIAND